MAVDGRRIVFWSRQSGRVELRSGETGELVAALRHDPAVPGSLLIADGQRVLTADDGQASLTDAETGRLIRRLDAHNGPIKLFSSHGKRIVTVAEDGEARAWDAQTGAPLGRLPAAGKVEQAVFSPDGGRIALVGADQGLRIWEPASGQSIRIESEWHQRIALRFSGDGERFLLVRNNRDPKGTDTVQLLDPASGAVTRELRHRAPVQNFAPSPSGQRVATLTTHPLGKSESTLHLWNAADGRKLAQHAYPTGRVLTAFTKDGGRLAALSIADSGQWKLQIFTSDGKPVASSEGTLRGSGSINASRFWFTVDGRHLLLRVQRQAMAVLVLDGESAAPIREHEIGTPNDPKFPVGPGGHLMLVMTSPSYDRVTPATLWDLVQGRKIAEIVTPKSISGAAFSPDDRLIAVGSYDGTIRIFSAVDGSPVRTYAGSTDRPINGISFSADGQMLLSGSSDGTVVARRLPSGEIVRTLAADRGGWVRNVAWLLDGQRVAAWTDRGVHVWNLKSGELLALVEGGGALEGQDRFLVTRDYRARIVRRLFGSTQELVDAVHAKAPRCLTAAERAAHFLKPEPPHWCIARGKWPYHTAEWRQWLAAKEAGKPTEMPGQ
jgi:WD40 repeat protein